MRSENERDWNAGDQRGRLDGINAFNGPRTWCMDVYVVQGFLRVMQGCL